MFHKHNYIEGFWWGSRREKKESMDSSGGEPDRKVQTVETLYASGVKW
jgi:hypothetical protein